MRFGDVWRARCGGASSWRARCEPGVLRAAFNPRTPEIVALLSVTRHPECRTPPNQRLGMLLFSSASKNLRLEG